MDDEQVKTLDLEEMRSYLLIGIDKDGEHVTAASQNLSLPEMGMLLGRAKIDLDIQVAAMGAYNAMQAQRQKAQAQIMTVPPGSGYGGRES